MYNTDDQEPDEKGGIDLAALAARLREVKAEKASKDAQRFEGLCKLVSKKRDEAVKGRTRLGIETIWTEDQEYCEGVDAYNKTRIQYDKPSASDGPLTEKGQGTPSTQCTAFFNITRQFVESGIARCGDILLPQGEWNWGVKKTPIGDDVNEPQGSTGANADYDEAQQTALTEKNARGEVRIKDWLIESKYSREYRKCIESAGTIGTGVLEGPVPTIRIVRAIDAQGELVTETKIVPMSRSLDPWDLYPDPNCGDDIHSGDYIFKRDHLTYKELQELKHLGEEYIADAIDKVLEEGPSGKYRKDDFTGSKSESDLFEIWYFTGNIDVADVDLIDDRFRQEIELQEGDNGEMQICGCDDTEERGKEFESVVVVLVNDTVIKGNLNPLQDGGFPYDVMNWQKTKGSWAGIGIARQMRVAQQLMLETGRSLVDNMALSSVPMIAMRQDSIDPADGIMELKKGKLWYMTGDQIRQIQEAIQFLQVPSLQKELMEIMMLAGKMAEDATGINSLLQGQQGSAPDTVGGMNMLHKNASALLRRIARISDDDVTEPHIKRYYDWLLMYGAPEEKGDFQVQATGSSVLVERELEAMQAQLLLQFSADPEFEISKKRIMQKIVKGWGFEPTDVFLTDEEKKQRQEAAAQQPPQQDPRIVVEQMRQQTAMQIAQQNAQVDQMRIQKDTDRDAVFAQGVTERNRITYEAQMAKLNVERELAYLEYANREKVNLDTIKSQLARDVMKNQMTKELAAMDAPASQLPKPPVEPPGTAAPGRSFTQ